MDYEMYEMYKLFKKERKKIKKQIAHDNNEVKKDPFYPVRRYDVGREDSLLADAWAFDQVRREAGILSGQLFEGNWDFLESRQDEKCSSFLRWIDDLRNIIIE